MTKRPTTCGLCNHPQRAEIEAKRAAGVSLRVLERAYDLSKDTISIHMRKHVAEQRMNALMAGTAKIEDLVRVATAEGKSYIENIAILRSLTMNALINASEAEDWLAVARLGTVLRPILGDIALITGEIKQAASGISIINNTLVFATPEYLSLQNFILQLNRDHPELRSQISAFLREAERASLSFAKGDGAPVIESTANAAAA